MKIQMRPKNSSSSSIYIARRRLMKRRVRQAVLNAALKKKKKKKNRQHLEARDDDPDPHDHEVVEQQCDGEGGLVPWSFGFFMDGEFIQLTRGFLVNFGGFPYYLPVVDNLGCLLGDFKHIDDLSLVQDDSPVADINTTTSSHCQKFNCGKLL